MSNYYRIDDFDMYWVKELISIQIRMYLCSVEGGKN